MFSLFFVIISLSFVGQGWECIYFIDFNFDLEYIYFFVDYVFLQDDGIYFFGIIVEGEFCWLYMDENGYIINLMLVVYIGEFLIWVSD